MEDCLTKGCENGGGTRGLCSKCYSSAQMMVARGEATMEELIEAGMILDHKKKASLFRNQFLALKNEKTKL